MNRLAFGIHAAVTGLLVVGLVVQQTQIASLRAALSPDASPVATATRGASAPLSIAERKAIHDAAVDAVTAAAPEGMAEEDVADLVASTVQDMLEAREAEQRDEAVDSWIEQASESTLVELEKVADKHGISDEAVREAHDLLVESLYYTVELRQRINEGETSVRDGKLEGDEYLVAFGAQMDRILGEDASTELGEAIRPGRGWR